MIYRPLGRTGWNVSAIGFGAWAIGGTWGDTDDTAAMAALHRALDRGVNFFDTADVYGDGHSERLLAGCARSGRATSSTLRPRPAAAWTRTWPTATATCAPSSSAACRTSMSRRSSCCSCTARPRRSTRCPRCSARWTIADDHRGFNRQGEAFDKGETFSGVDYEQGLAAVEELRQLLPEGVSMARLALRWILMHEAVTTAIPGGRTPAQVDENVSAADLAALPAPLMGALADLYRRRIAPQVHGLW